MNTSSILLISLIALVAPVASAQELPALVAKPYPGAVPQDTKDGKHVPCGGSNSSTYCFLTRDPVDKVRAFYAKEGIKLEPLITGQQQDYGGWRGLRGILEGEPSALLGAPLEFYEKKGGKDRNDFDMMDTHFNSLIVLTGAKMTPLQADDNGRQAIIEHEAMVNFALYSVSKNMAPLYGNIFMEPAKLVPHYNRHLSMWSGFFRKVDGNSAVKMKYVDMFREWTMPEGMGVKSDTDAKQEAMRKELKEILSRKPEKKREYKALTRGIHDRESREMIQPELDKILMSDPELAAWKKRSDALEQQEKAGSTKGSAQSNRTLRDEDVEAYLQALEKEAYYTRIMIHASGRHDTRDPAAVQRKWKEYTQ